MGPEKEDLCPKGPISDILGTFRRCPAVGKTKQNKNPTPSFHKNFFKEEISLGVCKWVVSTPTPERRQTPQVASNSRALTVGKVVIKQSHQEKIRADQFHLCTGHRNRS